MTSFETYGPWAALVAVSGLVGWAFRTLLTATLKHLDETAGALKAIHDEVRGGFDDVRDGIARLEARPDGIARPRRSTNKP